MQDNKKMDTLAEVMNDLKDRGYTEEFKLENNKLRVTSKEHDEHHFSPNQIKIVEFHRFEGESDPGDMTVLYAIETDAGIKGVLTDGFGTYSNAGLSEFLKKVQELHKGDNVY